MTDAVSTFFSAWGMADAASRLSAIKGSLAQDASYMDPRTEAPLSGPEAIASYVGMFTQQAPGAVAEVISAANRSGVTRATLAFKMPNCMEQTGQYFVEYDKDDRIARMVGFVGTGAAE